MLPLRLSFPVSPNPSLTKLSDVSSHIVLFNMPAVRVVFRAVLWRARSFPQAIALIVSSSLLLACSNDQAALVKSEAPPSEEMADGARDAADLLGSRLKKRLVSAMQTGGPVAAIDVCAKEASAIAEEVSSETGYNVGRTALRLRNAKNAPDAWEREKLDYFIDAIENGTEPFEWEVSELWAQGDEVTMRWARPILLDAPCATCHGDAVSPELLAEIRSRYPDDAATGFSIGEVRGMFTVKKKLP